MQGHAGHAPDGLGGGPQHQLGRGVHRSVGQLSPGPVGQGLQHFGVLDAAPAAQPNQQRERPPLRAVRHLRRHFRRHFGHRFPGRPPVQRAQGRVGSRRRPGAVVIQPAPGLSGGTVEQPAGNPPGAQGLQQGGPAAGGRLAGVQCERGETAVSGRPHGLEFHGRRRAMRGFFYAHGNMGYCNEQGSWS